MATSCSLLPNDAIEGTPLVALLGGLLLQLVSTSATMLLLVVVEVALLLLLLLLLLLVPSAFNCRQGGHRHLFRLPACRKAMHLLLSHGRTGALSGLLVNAFNFCRLSLIQLSRKDCFELLVKATKPAAPMAAGSERSGVALSNATFKSPDVRRIVLTPGTETIEAEPKVMA